MKLRPASAAALLPMVGGCALTQPLREGVYSLELVALVEDSCGYTEEDVGVGAVDVVDLAWDGNVLLLTNASGTGSYLWDGNQLSAEAYEEIAVDEVCFLSVDSTWTGEVLDRERFGIINDMVLDWFGDCSAWDVSDFPCLTAVAWEGRYISP